MYHVEPIDLGPGSLLWRWAGDNRLSFTGLSAGILQLMHPGLGAGVIEHSAFFTEPWDRIIRSLPEILGVVYDGPEAERTGHRVRDYHRRIKGVDALGRRYSALAPETFWWAHATFQFSVEQVADRFDGHRLARRRPRAALPGGRRVVPPLRREHASGPPGSRCVGRGMGPLLHRRAGDDRGGRASGGHGAAREGHRHARPARGGRCPIQREIITPLFRLTAIGGLPDVVRRRFDIPWGAVEAAELKLLEVWVRETWRFMPRPLRWAPTRGGRLAAGVTGPP